MASVLFILSKKIYVNGLNIGKICQYMYIKFCIICRLKYGHMVVLGTALGTLMVPGYWSLQMG